MKMQKSRTPHAPDQIVEMSEEERVFMMPDDYGVAKMSQSVYKLIFFFGLLYCDDGHCKRRDSTVTDVFVKYFRLFVVVYRLSS